MKTATKQYPDHTLEEALRARGFSIRCSWQMKGPENTQVAYMEHLMAHEPGRFAGTFIVQTFVGGGWSVYVEPSHRNEIAATVDAVEAMLREPKPAPEVDGPWEMSGPEDGDGDDTVLVMHEGSETIRINEPSDDDEARKEIARKVASLLNDGRAELE